MSESPHSEDNKEAALAPSPQTSQLIDPVSGKASESAPSNLGNSVFSSSLVSNDAGSLRSSTEDADRLVDRVTAGVIRVARSKRRTSLLKRAFCISVVLAAVSTAGYFVWTNYGDEISAWITEQTNSRFPTTPSSEYESPR